MWGEGVYNWYMCYSILLFCMSESSSCSEAVLHPDSGIVFKNLISSMFFSWSSREESNIEELKYTYWIVSWKNLKHFLWFLFFSFCLVCLSSRLISGTAGLLHPKTTSSFHTFISVIRQQRYFGEDTMGNKNSHTLSTLQAKCVLFRSFGYGRSLGCDYLH